jgi:hypothetical protein
MRTRSVVLTVLAGLTFCPHASNAHHQLDKTFVRERTITLAGTVMKTEWVNPHVLLTLEVRGAAGKVQDWRIELDPPNALLRRGWKRDSPAVGTAITMTAYPSIDGGPTAVARTVTLASGEQLAASTDNSWNWREMGIRLPALTPSANKSRSR